MKTPKKAKPTRVDLERKIVELESQLAHVYASAARELPKAGTQHLMASGALLRLHALGGRELITPVLIRDGLSDATITALTADIKRSYEQATASKPK